MSVGKTHQVIKADNVFEPINDGFTNNYLRQFPSGYTDNNYVCAYQKEAEMPILYH